MAFQQSTVHINRYWCFSNGLTQCFENDVIKPDGLNLLVDVSSSMTKRRGELKLYLSALACMADMVGKLTLPAICGNTRLADFAAQVSAQLGPDEKFIVATDGDDNGSQDWKTTVVYPAVPAVDEDQAAWDQYAIDKSTYLERKREDLIKHLEDSTNAHIFLVGFGEEVKDFIALAAKAGRRAQPIFIPDGTTATQMATVVRTAVRRPRRVASASAAPVAMGVAAPVDGGVPADVAPQPPTALTAAVEVITIDAPECAEHQATEEEAAAVTAAAGLVTEHGFLSMDEIKKVFADIETALTVGTVDKQLARAAVLWYLLKIQEKGPLAGALLGGKRGHVFVDPGYPTATTGWCTYLNMFLSRLQSSIVRQNPKSSVHYNIEGRFFTFDKVNTYSLLEKVQLEVLKALAEDAAWCPPLSALTMVAKGNSSAEAFAKATGCAAAVDQAGAARKRVLDAETQADARDAEHADKRARTDAPEVSPALPPAERDPAAAAEA